MKEVKKYIHSDSLYLEDPNEEKTRIMCSMCGQVKDKSEFYYKEKQHKYNCYCRKCERLYQKEYKRIYRERKREEENYNHIPRLD